MKKIISAFYWKTAFWAFVFISAAFVATQYNHYLDLRGSYLNTAQRISRGLSSGFSFFYHNAQNISYNPALKSMDRREAKSYFNSLVALYPEYDMIILSDKEGNFVMSNTIGSEGQALDYRKGQGESFLPKLNLSEDLQKGFIGTAALDFAENDFVSKIYGFKKIGMSFSAPVLDKEGELVGHVTTFINQSWLQKELESMTDEFFSNGSEGLEVFVANKAGRTLASSSEIEAPTLGPIPFEVSTAQFIKHTKEGNFEQSARGFATFLQKPFFAISEFKHRNFLSDMGWSLILRMDKQTALGSIINNAAWFWGAFTVFMIVAMGLRLKASSEIEHEFKEKTGANEIALKSALRKTKKGNVGDVKQIVGELGKHIDFELPHFSFRPLSVASCAKDMEEEKCAQKNIEKGINSVQEVFGAQSRFDRAISKRKLADHEQERIESALAWNLGQAEKLLKDLKVLSLNLELSNGSNLEAKSRELDGIVQQAFTYFEEAKKMNGGIAKNREKASKDLDASYQEKRENDEVLFVQVKESFEFAQQWCSSLAKDIDFYRNREGEWRREFDAFNRKRSDALEKIEKLKVQIKKLEAIAGPSKRKQEVKKAA